MKLALGILFLAMSLALATFGFYLGFGVIVALCFLLAMVATACLGVGMVLTIDTLDKRSREKKEASE